MIVISDRKHYLYLYLYLCVIYVRQRAVPSSAVLRCTVLWRSIASDTAMDRPYTAEHCTALHCYLFPRWSRIFCVFTATNCLPFIPNEAGAELRQHVQIMFCPLVRHLFHCLLISWSCTPRTSHAIPSHRVTFLHTHSDFPRILRILCIALHCIALHCIALHCIALHCIALHCIALHCIVLQSRVRHLPTYLPTCLPDGNIYLFIRML
jgi:hypothetical protein